jgi:hypothetical protein
LWDAGLRRRRARRAGIARRDNELTLRAALAR